MSADDEPYVVERGPLNTRFEEIRHFASVDSTNRYLLDEARRAPRDGLVAVADHQSAGRGRLGRRWEAPHGANLLASVVLTPAFPPDSLHLCSVAVALAAADACRELAGIDVSLKWPNDLMVGPRKLAGILAESVPVAARSGVPRACNERAVVVGIGLNLRWPPSDDDVTAAGVPLELRASATSVWRETGIDVEPTPALAAILTFLEPAVSSLGDAGGRTRLAQEYRRCCGTLGQRVQVSLSDEEITGTATDITSEGHLVVDVGASFKTLTAGDVVHVRGDES